MSTRPRIIRAIPQGVVTRPGVGIPVVATVRWHRSPSLIVGAIAIAWTATEVEIDWLAPWGERRSDWLPVGDIRRLSEIAGDG